ncbi:hypothetical protein [Hyphomicrobium sp. ghe19]|uniref:hypothetical protein n=1 Tax=Hyphomicrobium sp. ghe19 TaxID=2682968 RepID=UPI001367623F|nr:hypothetical protein HYPP_00115 [Hyphomicrobium sp. ghe19]
MAKNSTLDASGLAALGICESLLVTLTELKIMSEADARALLIDVKTAHQEASVQSKTPEKHQAAIEIIQRIISGKNGVR